MSEECRTIKPDTGYRITGAMRDQPKRICFVSDRRGNEITVMLISGIVLATVVPAEVYGREYAQLETPYGVYNLSPCGEVKDINDVALVCDVIKGCRED